MYLKLAEGGRGDEEKREGIPYIGTERCRDSRSLRLYRKQCRAGNPRVGSSRPIALDRIPSRQSGPDTPDLANQQPRCDVPQERRRHAAATLLFLVTPPAVPGRPIHLLLSNIIEYHHVSRQYLPVDIYFHPSVIILPCQGSTSHSPSTRPNLISEPSINPNCAAVTLIPSCMPLSEIANKDITRKCRNGQLDRTSASPCSPDISLVYLLADLE